MTAIFKMEAVEIYRLHRFYKKAPHMFIKTMNNMLNSFAFGTRSVSLNIIKKHMVVRAPAFVAGRIRVQKSYGTRLQSIVGSVAIKGGASHGPFTGWEEQEGGSTTRTHWFTLAARMGNIRRRAIGAARLRPGSRFITPDQYQGKTERFRTTAMLMDIRRRRERKPFVILRHSKYKKGLYRFRRGRIEILQRFKERRKPPQIHWMSGAVRLYITENRLRTEWAKSVRYVMAQRRK